MAYSGGRGVWDLALTQPLFDWGRWQNYEQSKLIVADVEVQLQQAYQDLLLRVADAYFNVLYAQDALTATEAEKAAVAGQLESAKRNFELGNATITDTYEAQARYDLVVAQELRLQNDLDVRREELAKIIGTAPGALAELPPGVQLPAPQPARVADWSNQAESSSLEVLRAQLLTRIAGREIQIARSGHYPTLNLRATSGSASDAVMRNAAPGKPIDSTIGVVLSIPLYSGVAYPRRSRKKCSWNRRRATISRRRGARRCRPRASTTPASPAAWRASRRWRRARNPAAPRSRPTARATKWACASTWTCSTPSSSSMPPSATWRWRATARCCRGCA